MGLKQSLAIRPSKVTERHVVGKERVNLLQCLALALGNAEIDKDGRDDHERAEDKADLAAETGVVRVDEIRDGEINEEAVWVETM